VPLCQLVLDRILPGEQPVHGAVELVLAGIGHAEILGQGSAAPPARRRQLGVGRHDAGRDHGYDQVGLAARPRAEQARDVEPAHGAQHRGGVAVRPGGDDLEALAGRHERLAAQGPAHDVDQAVGQMREVAQRLVLDLAVLAKAAAQQMGAVDAAFVLARGGDDVNGSASGGHDR